MSEIANNINIIKSRIPASVKLIAVSKTRTVNDILAAYNSGQKYFGENRVQELINKKDLLPGDIEWHLIGHLQSNKVKNIVSFISMIHSIDSFKLLSAVNAEAEKINRVIDCLLQIHIASEDTKFGFSMKELVEMIEMHDLGNFKYIHVCGVMGMATFTDNRIQIHKEFAYLADCFKKLKTRFFAGIPYFKDISMGMSGDYEIALEEGSTMIRIGSLIFGERKII